VVGRKGTTTAGCGGKVRGYQPRRKVVIIPVDLVKGEKQKIEAAKYQDFLNATYGRIGITYQVTVDDSFRDNLTWDADGNRSVQVKGSPVISNDYQGEEKAMINAYVAMKGASAIEPGTAYLLAPYEVSQIEPKLLGKMPAEEQFGFIYTGATTDAGIARTIAHELGHGAYHLEHMFNTIYLGDKSKNKTANLMDYADGNELWKFQWDVVQAPGHVWGILQKDKDAQLKVAMNDVEGFLNAIRVARIEGNVLSLNSSKLNETTENSKSGIIFDGYTYAEIKIIRKPLTSNFTYNPLFYKNYFYNGITDMSDDYGFSFNDGENNQIITVIAATQTESDKLKAYLFGDCSFIEKLNQIHLASSTKSNFTLTYSNNCTVIDILNGENINGIIYDQLSCQFTSNFIKGTDKIINPASFKERTTGFDILDNNNEIVFSIDYFKAVGSQMTTDVYNSNKDKLKEWLFESVTVSMTKTYVPDITVYTAKIQVTGAQLKKIFPKTPQSRCDEIANLLNKYSDKFEINTPILMANFIGQIGAETGGLTKLVEDPNYRASTMVNLFGKSKYCDLYKGYDCIDLTVCIEINKYGDGRPNLCSTAFPTNFDFNNASQIKDKYLKSANTKGIRYAKPDFFNYVYSCRNGNRAPSFGDGYAYRGVGFIHITGRGNYEAISDEWNGDVENPQNKKYFHLQSKEGGDLDELISNPDVAIKASMYYWKINNLNNLSKGISKEDIRKVSATINTGNVDTPRDQINGISSRETYTTNAYNILK
jgi:predicted chitinase